MFERNIQYINRIQLTKYLEISPGVNKPPVIIITAERSESWELSRGWALGIGGWVQSLANHKLPFITRAREVWIPMCPI